MNNKYQPPLGLNCTPKVRHKTFEVQFRLRGGLVFTDYLTIFSVERVPSLRDVTMNAITRLNSLYAISDIASRIID